MTSINTPSATGERKEGIQPHETVMLLPTAEGVVVNQPLCLGAGSISSSVFNLASATIGAGILGLPQAMMHCGAITGSVLLAGCCAATIYTIRLLAVCYEKTGYTTYEQLARNLVGRKFELLTIFLIISFCWGITVVYVVAIGDILENLGKADWFPDVFRGTWGRRLITTMFWSIFMMPLSLFKMINALRHASFIGIMSSAFLVLVIVYHSISDKPPKTNMVYANWDVNLVLALPVFLFSYCCQTNFFEIYTELTPRTIPRMTRASAMSMISCTSLYIIAGIAGLANFGEGVKGNVLKNYSATHSWYMAIAFIAISFTVTMAFPICMFPTRDAVLQLLNYKDAYTAPPRSRILVSFTLSTLSLVAGLFVSSIQSLFGLLGGICGSTISYMWPALFMMMLPDWSRANYGLSTFIGVWTMVIMGAIAGILGTGVSVYHEWG